MRPEGERPVGETVEPVDGAGVVAVRRIELVPVVSRTDRAARGVGGRTVFPSGDRNVGAVNEVTTN